jgi:hypothetical protein
VDRKLADVVEPRPFISRSDASFREGVPVEKKIRGTVHIVPQLLLSLAVRMGLVKLTS